MNAFNLLAVFFVVGAVIFWTAWRAWLGGLAIKYPDGAPWYMRRWLQMLVCVAAVYFMVSIFGNWQESALLGIAAAGLWSLEHAPGLSMGRMLPKISRDHWSRKVTVPLANLVAAIEPDSFLSYADLTALTDKGRRRLALWCAVYLSGNYALRSLALVGVANIIVLVEGGRGILAPWFSLAGLLAGPAYWLGWALYDRGLGIRGDNVPDQGGHHNGEAINGGLWGGLLALALLAANVSS